MDTNKFITLIESLVEFRTIKAIININNFNNLLNKEVIDSPNNLFIYIVNSFFIIADNNDN